MMTGVIGMKTDLSKYDNSWFNPGRGFLVRTIWHFVNALFLQNPLCPSSRVKIRILKLFGAKIGKGVLLKPCINVKYPWNLEIGNYSWIGENVWMDSLTLIKIGSNVCISQGAYLCTGSHDWSDSAFGLIVKPIVIEDGAWVAAKAVVLPGVTVASHSVLAAGAVVSKDMEPFMVYAGNPAEKVKERTIK
jgi:putative colanic acid biosynthesis acetyltransferase WcaF